MYPKPLHKNLEPPLGHLEAPLGQKTMEFGALGALGAPNFG